MMLKRMMMSLLLVAASLGGGVAWAQQDGDEAIHNELRAVLKVIETAINSKQFDDMLPVLSQDIRATPINQEFLRSHEELSAFFRKWFGPGGFLGSLEFDLEPDARTELSADRTWGGVYGHGTEKYTLADGRKYELKTRWTATVALEEDGKWRVRTIHIGTDFLDNALLNDARAAVPRMTMTGAVGGALAGLLLGWLLARRKKVGQVV